MGRAGKPLIGSQCDCMRSRVRVPVVKGCGQPTLLYMRLPLICCHGRVSLEMDHATVQPIILRKCESWRSAAAFAGIGTPW